MRKFHLFSFQTVDDDISKQISELTFINKNGEEMPFPLKDYRLGPCLQTDEIENRRIFECRQSFSIPDNFPNVSSNRE